MHQNAQFWGNFQKISRGRPPGPPPAGRGDPLPHPPPFGALRLSEAFGFRPLCSNSFPVLQRKKCWTPLTVYTILNKKKESYNVGDVTFINSRWKWIYGIWNIVNSHIPCRLCYKFRVQSGVKWLCTQWVEFQKVLAGRIIRKIRTCIDRRYSWW